MIKRVRREGGGGERERRKGRKGGEKRVNNGRVRNR